MTYLLRADQTEAIREWSRKTCLPVTELLRRAARHSARGGTIHAIKKNGENVPLVRFSVSRRVDGVGSARMRDDLDRYLAHLASRPKPDFEREIAALDNEIENLWAREKMRAARPAHPDRAEGGFPW